MLSFRKKFIFFNRPIMQVFLNLKTIIHFIKYSETVFCLSHFLTFLAAITISDISIYFSITFQSGMSFLTVTHSCQLLRIKALPLLIKSDSMFQLLFIFVKVELLYAENLLFSECALLIQLLFHLSSVHLLLLGLHH